MRSRNIVIETGYTYRPATSERSMPIGMIGLRNVTPDLQHIPTALDGIVLPVVLSRKLKY